MFRLPARRVIFLALAALTGCRPSGGVDPTVLGYRVETTEVDFGRVLEGDLVVKKVGIVGTGVSDLIVDLATDPPFSVMPVVNVPGGASTSFEVRFTAGALAATGELRLSAAMGKATVKLKGIGVRPKVCTASSPCKRSTYSLPLDACIETQAPEGATCQPDSVCLEKGECRMGVCQGVARACDDKDACTIDSCAMDLGCVHATRACPIPTGPCRVAACDSVTGCSEAIAPDGTGCGPIDCVKAFLCVSGACAEVATPDGFICGPATPCQAESRCRAQVCTAPDAGVMAPRTVVRLPGALVEERPSILVHSGNVFFQMCGLPLPPPMVPVMPDGGRDAGADAGADAGVDGGVDAGVDAGFDAGPEGDGGSCALVSYTGTGFERWTAHYPDPANPRRLVQIGQRGAVLLQSQGLEVRLLANGTPTLVPLEGEVVPRGVAQSPELDLWALVTNDAGTSLVRWTDGGLQPGMPIDAGVSLLAIDENGAAWLYSPDGGSLGFLQSSDAGWSLQWRNPGQGSTSLTTTDGTAFAGGRHLVRADGGFVRYDWQSDGGAALELVERPVLSGETAGLVFFRECSTAVMSCLDIDKGTWVQAFSLIDGQFLWRSRVLPPGVHGRVEEVALTGIKPGAVAVLVQVSLDGGAQAYLEGHAEGKRLVRCAMPEGTVLGGAVFTAGSMHALVNRDGGAWLLESYDLGALPLLQRGWPQADGISGTRRAR